MDPIAESPAGPPAPGAPPRADEVRTSPWRTRWQALRLPVQHAWIQFGAGLPVVAATLVLTDVSPWGVAGLLGLWVASTTAAVIGAWHTGRDLLALAESARAVRRSESEEELPLQKLSACDELQRASRALSRLVEQQRERQRALKARVEELGVRLELRTHQLTTLEDLSVGLADKEELHELVDEALGALEQALSYTSASVWSRSDTHPEADVVLMGYRHIDEALVAEDLRGARLSRQNLQRFAEIERQGQPVVENRVRQGLLSWLWSFLSDDARTSELYRGTRAWMAVPMKSRDRVMGVLRVDHSEPDFFDVERMRLLTAVGSQTGLAMRHAELLAQQKDIAVLAERNRIARDLHDAVSQTLFAANLLAGSVGRALDVEAEAEVSKRSQALRDKVRTIERLNRGALAEMRMLLFELRPDALDEAPLAELVGHAAEAAVCRHDVVIERHIGSDRDLTSAQRVNLYRIVQEALSNIVRHSGATHVLVSWEKTGPETGTLRIADDGSGFDPEQPKPGHFGLSHMVQRAADIGAKWALTSAPGQGTEIRVDLGVS